MKYLSTADKANVLQSLATGTTTIASSVDSLQTGTFPSQKLLQHIDPGHYGHDLSALLPSRRVSYGVHHAR